MLHIRVDDAIKAQATEALTAMGVLMSDAVRLFVHRVVMDQAFPLELKVPNAPSLAAMAESRATMAKRHARFASAQTLFADLEKTPANERAALSRVADYTQAFLKDWQRLTHSGVATWCDLRKP